MKTVGIEKVFSIQILNRFLLSTIFLTTAVYPSIHRFLFDY